MAFVRLLARRFAKLVVALLPGSARRYVPRVPFSRFASLIPALFSGHERVQWRGITLIVDPGEVFGYWFYFSGDREPDPELDWLQRQSEGARLFADIGAHIGMYAIALAASQPSLHVTAFEASPRNADRLRENISLNPETGGRISVAQVALSNSNGTRDFVEAPSRNSGVGHLVETGRSDADSIRVPTVTLSDYFAHRPSPDVVKIDVEGAEFEVLQEWGELPLSRSILIELDAPETADDVDHRPDVVRWLEERAYHLEYRVGLEVVDGCPQPMPARFHVMGTRIDPTSATDFRS